MLIRPARPDEAETLTQLAIRSKRSWGYDDDFMRRVEPDMIVKPEYIARGFCLIAEEPGRIFGYVLLEMREHEAFLHDLFIEPDCFGQGLGTALFDRAVEYARAQRATRLILQSDPHAEAFYERFGMRCVARAASIVGGGRTLPVMEMQLC